MRSLPVRAWWGSLSALALLLGLAGAPVLAGQPATVGGASAGPVSAAAADGASQERSVGEWLLRAHEASRMRSYIGTFVVSSGNAALSSARIWHACDGQQQLERVEALSGPPRSTFRRNDEVVVLLPDSKVVRTERRESLGLFPGLLLSADNQLGDFYTARRTGIERVAGFEADVVHLVPRDKLRYGYRIWSERKTGLVVKLQTLATDGAVLEQAAFSELQMDAPVKIDRLLQMMTSPEGWRVEKPEVVKADAAAEGWQLRAGVPGFRPMSCYKRPVAGAPEGTLQWIFSDGLASVSLFVEAYDKARHAQEGLLSAGATQTLTRRLQNWWLTAVGEVPPETLKAFAQSLDRRR